jgi:hypothetical protein
MKRLGMLTALMLTVLMIFSGLALAQEKAKKKAEVKHDATIELKQGQVAVGIGYSWGEGILTYKEKKYPFKVKGLSVVDVGITKATAKGVVYNLKKLEDFEGNYTTVSAEGTIGGGAGATNMNNQNGVTINLISTTKGVNLKLAPSGVEVTLKK